MKSARIFAAVALCTPAVVFAASSSAEQFPSRPIRAIVPFTAGSIDTLSRTLGDRLAQKWGQPVVVDNRPGAGATIGTALAAKAEPDGYTWLMVTNPYAIGLSLYRNLTYSEKNFQAVSLVATTPMVMSVNPSVGVQSAEELISLAKSKPKQLNFASAGVGSATHMAGELFVTLANMPVTHVPYKGSAPAVSDLLGGRVQMIFDPLPSSMSQIQSGKFQALVVTSGKRSPLLPNVPTAMEAGIAGYDVNWWGGIVVPAGTPRAVIEKINQAVTEALQAPDLRQKFTALGYELVNSTPEEFSGYIHSEIRKWAQVIKERNIRID